MRGACDPVDLALRRKVRRGTTSFKIEPDTASRQPTRIQHSVPASGAIRRLRVAQNLQYEQPAYKALLAHMCRYVRGGWVKPAIEGRAVSFNPTLESF